MLRRPRWRRERAAWPGMLLHQDGSRHEWVPGQYWDLIVTMDDATNEHYSMFFVEEEGTASSLRGVKEVIEARGLFSALYTDRGSHYWHTPQAGGKVDKVHLTQFGQAMARLGIEMIPAYSPEARGHSERMFRTHQDRLPKELAAAGITDMAAANRYLKEVYLPAFNAEFMQPVTREMLLPRAEKGEHLLVVQHPSFYAKPNYEFTYDRNPRSTACIPYGLGKYYVCGGVNGGTAPAFLELCRTLDKRIRRDLQHNVIALWHDESQINRYILFRHDFRVLDPSFCYPEGWDHLPFPCIIRIRSKARYIDIPALRKDAPETKLSPAVARWNHFAMRAARWTQNHIFKKGS